MASKEHLVQSWIALNVLSCQEIQSVFKINFKDIVIVLFLVFFRILAKIKFLMIPTYRLNNLIFFFLS